METQLGSQETLHARWWLWAEGREARGKVMRKMKADSLADLVTMAARLRLGPAPTG